MHFQALARKVRSISHIQPSRGSMKVAVSLWRGIGSGHYQRMHDYIIVGAGSAGCVLASRLSEDPDVSVLLIEAGPPDTWDNIHIPVGVTALSNSEVDWAHYTFHEPHCDGRRIYLPRGRVLGGSSSINAMVYIRGNRADYDAWRDAGCEGWGWDDLLPYFERSIEGGLS